MATIQENDDIRIDDNGLYLKDYNITDSDIISYFQNLSESENLDEHLRKLLQIGIVVTKSIGTNENVNYVEKAFENLDSNFSDRLEKAFGESGQFSNVIKDNFGEDGIMIKELLDPNREGSPLYILKRELDGNLDEIKVKLGINEAVKAEKERGTKKGIEFEEQCESSLQFIAQIHADTLENTSDVPGKVGRSKKGDFVLTLADSGKKIVFEMKNKGSISQKEIHEELNTAIENREADYGIFVAKYKSSLPDSVGWFNEYNGNHLVCAVQDNDEQDLIDTGIIQIAYKWARTKLHLENVQGKKIDSEFILEKASKIQVKINDLRKIKTQCTSIDKSTEAIRQTTLETEKEIKNQVDEILNSLS